MADVFFNKLKRYFEEARNELDYCIRESKNILKDFEYLNKKIEFIFNSENLKFEPSSFLWYEYNCKYIICLCEILESIRENINETIRKKHRKYFDIINIISNSFSRLEGSYIMLTQKSNQNKKSIAPIDDIYELFLKYKDKLNDNMFHRARIEKIASELSSIGNFQAEKITLLLRRLKNEQNFSYSLGDLNEGLRDLQEKIIMFKRDINLFKKNIRKLERTSKFIAMRKHKIDKLSEKVKHKIDYLNNELNSKIKGIDKRPDDDKVTIGDTIRYYRKIVLDYENIIKLFNLLEKEIQQVFNKNYLSEEDLPKNYKDLLVIDYGDLNKKSEEFKREVIFFEEFEKAYETDNQKRIFEICSGQGDISTQKDVNWRVIGFGLDITAYSGVVDILNRKKLPPKEYAIKLKKIMAEGIKGSDKALGPVMYGIGQLKNIYFYLKFHQKYGKGVLAFNCRDYCVFQNTRLDEEYAIIIRNKKIPPQMLKLFVIDPTKYDQYSDYEREYVNDLIENLKNLNVPFEIKHL